MKRVLKSSLSLLLAITIILSSAYVGLSEFCIGVEVNAEESTSGTDTSVSDGLNEEYIYYSDLFYGYSYYLTNNLDLLDYNLLSQELFMQVIDEYITTDHFLWSVGVHSIEIATDPTLLTKHITDNIGLSNFQFNDELDVANQKFVTAVCDVNLEAAKEVGADNKYVKNVKKFLGVAAKVEQTILEDEAYYNDLDKPELYKTVLDQSWAYLEECCSELKPKLPSLKSRIYTTICESSAIVGTVSEALSFTEAVGISIMMQETQMELIQDIIDTQPSSSTLYKGLTRLKNQLSSGFISYFADTFIMDKVYDKVIDAFTGKMTELVLGNWNTYGSMVSAVVGIINSTVFKGILGLDYSEYTSALMLIEYSNGLFDSLQTKATVFESFFNNSQIKKYETLYNAYISTRITAINQCEELAKHNTDYDDSYVRVYGQTFKEDCSYDTYIDRVKSYIKSLPKENRIVKNQYGTINLGVVLTLSEGSDTINDSYIYCLDGVYNGSIKLVRDGYSTDGIQLNFIEGQNVTISGDLYVEIRYGSFTIPQNTAVTVLGDFTFYKPDRSGDANTEAYMYNYGALKVHGDANIIGSYSYYFGLDKRANVRNDGTFEVLGNLTLDEIAGTFTNNGILKVSGHLAAYNLGTIVNNNTIYANDFTKHSSYKEPTPKQTSTLKQDANAKLYISGDFNSLSGLSSVSTSSTTIEGTVIFNGTETQNIRGLSAPTIILENESETGVNFLTSISPSILFNHNGYNFSASGTFADYDCDGLKDNVDPYPLVGNPCTVTVSSENIGKGTVSESFDSVGGTTVTVYAEPTFKYDFYCWKDASGTIVSNNAKYSFVVKGDTSLTAYFNKRRRFISVDTENGILDVPTTAEIESIVTVVPVPNEGCIFISNSITVENEKIEGNTFVMPDNDVLICAEFVVNDYYFLLKKVLNEAKGIDQTLYLKETVQVLQNAINNAQNSLVNDISQEESNARIKELQSAMSDLILITGNCGDSLVWNYDEASMTLSISGTGEMHDYAVADSPWYALANDIISVEISREITSIGDNAFYNCNSITDVYYEYTQESWEALPKGENNSCLDSANIHCHVHNFIGSVIMNPTCIDVGEKVFSCSCGDTYNESIDALGHEYSTEWTVDVEPTCISNGSKSHHCSRCDSIVDITTIEAHGHGYSTEWTIDLDVTCTTDGSKSHHCIYCDDKVDITVITAIGHSYSEEWTVDVAPTCMEDGSKSRHCSNCDDRIDVASIPATGHKFSDEWIIDKEPTCSETGLKYKLCLNSGDEVISETIDALGHDYSTEWIIDEEVTCTTNGSKSHHCSRCDSKIDVTIIEYTGHTFINDTCNKCSALYSDICTDTLVHSFTNYVYDENGTDNNSGTITAYCDNGCGSKRILDNIHISIDNDTQTIYITGTGVLTRTHIEKFVESIDSIKHVVISEGISTIGNYAFDGFINIESIDIPNTVFLVGDYAFKNCSSIKNLRFPESVGDFGSYVLHGCSSLEILTVPFVGSSINPSKKAERVLGHFFGDIEYENSVSVNQAYTTFAGIGLTKTYYFPPNLLQVTVLGGELFQGAFNNCTSITNIILESNVSNIEDQVFSSCRSLVSISIPERITSIGSTAFRYCGSLKYVFYSGSESDWGNISIGDKNESLTNAIIHYNSTDHTYSDEWTIDVKATCVETGVMSHHCLYCDKKMDETTIEAIGHNYVIKSTETNHPHTVLYECSFCEDTKTEASYNSDCSECNHSTETVIQETVNTQIDYDNYIIRTSVQSADEITDILSLSESANVSVVASHKYNDVEFYGTGTIITVYDGDNYIGNFTLIVNGDTNGDSICDALDATLIALVINNLKDTDVIYKMAGDSNSDDIVDIIDYQAIVNKVVA